MTDAVERFAVEATDFREWVLRGSDTGPEAARQALLRVVRLYSAALVLPPHWSEDLESGNPSAAWGSPIWPAVYLALVARLPFQYYSEVFNSLSVPPGEPGIGDLADDLADIFAEVASGLNLFEVGQRTEAVWEWGFGLVHHWGKHATSAIHALQCWSAAEHPELLAEQKQD